MSIPDEPTIELGEPIEVHVIADSTGDTGARVARAAAAQFASHPFRIIRHPRIATTAGLHLAIERVKNGRGNGSVVVFSTLVNDDLRALVADLTAEIEVPFCDLMAQALETLEQASGDMAERVPNRPVGIDADYFKRIAAMEFAVKHDDGQRPEGVVDADIVLVGASRTGKTPLSMYLGYLGFKTANIPLVPNIAPPSDLYAVDRWKIVGLTIDPSRLAMIRGRRVRTLGTTRGIDGYAELNRIYDELEAIGTIHRRLGCPVVDTTSLALEESAGRIIDLVADRTRSAMESDSTS
ncbi:MAG: pyruvate, water dikinase regulatory protein [Antricoccus sp.]